MHKKITKIFLTILILLGITAPFSQTNPVYAADKITAKSALGVDLDTGKILLDQNSQEVLPIASMTKILTLYIVREAIADKKLSFDDKVDVTKDIARLSQDKDLSNVPLTAGQSYTVKELYDSAWIYSSNAAAMLLAEKVAGSQAKFVTLMKKQLKKFGITDAKIVNVSGLNNSDILASLRVKGTNTNDENEMSAQDLAIIAQALLKKYPETLDITKITDKTFAPGTVDEFKMHTFNRMLPREVDSFADLSVDGLKTGTTEKAGESFVGTVKKNGFRIITVVMNAEGQKDDLAKRFTATAQVMRQIYNTYTKKVIYHKGDTKVTKPLTLKYGKEKSVNLAPEQDVVAFETSNADANIQIDVDYKKEVNSTTKGQSFGTIEVSDDNLGYLPKEGKINLVASKTVKEKNFFERLWQGLTEFFGGLF